MSSDPSPGHERRRRCPWVQEFAFLLPSSSLAFLLPPLPLPPLPLLALPLHPSHHFLEIYEQRQQEQEQEQEQEQQQGQEPLLQQQQEQEQEPLLQQQGQMLLLYYLRCCL